MDLVAGQGLKVSRVSDNLLPTPVVNDMGAGKTVDGWDEWTAKTKEKHQNGNGHGPSLNIEMLRLMPTPNTMDSLPARTPEQIAEAKQRTPAGYSNLREAVVNDLFPTPMSRDYKGDTAPHERDGIVQTDTIERAIFHSGEVLLPTTRVSMGNGPTSKEIREGNPKSRIETEVMLGATSWGKFEPAIRRWETVLGRPAPVPTKPDGKDGAHRLSAEFTEWMMGLEPGWLTDPAIGLTRNEQLKACGNGVVPQQAEFALRILLDNHEVKLEVDRPKTN